MALRAREITPLDVKATESNWIQYSSKHIKHLPPGTITDFEWKDYCPTGFRLIQELEDIDHDEYTHSVCNDETLRKISSGKIGNLFLLSKDDHFLIKIIRKSEMKVILEMLPNYYRHIQKYRSTLLSKIYGAHAVKPVGGVKTYFVVMSNILQSDVFMNKVYDLKGSSQGRTAKKIKVREKTILKDLDLDFCFYVDQLTRHRLIKQTKLDCELLETEGIMDYSLMLGLQVKSSHRGSLDGLSPVSNGSMRRDSLETVCPKYRKTASFSSPDRSSAMYSCTSSRDSVDSESSVSISSAASVSSVTGLTVSVDAPQESKQTEATSRDIRPKTNGPSTNFGMKIPARAVRVQRAEPGSISETIRGNKSVRGEDWYDVILYLGIMDTFQNYGVRKRIEHCYKAIHHDSKAISAVNPKVYSSRFQEFISQIFLSDEDCQ